MNQGQRYIDKIHESNDIIKDKFISQGDEVELITPNEQFVTKIESIKNKDGDEITITDPLFIIYE